MKSLSLGATTLLISDYPDMDKPLRIGSLCSGYGGLDMGVQAAIGGTVAWHCEYDKTPSKILVHHWPGIPNHGDVWTTDWWQVEPVDVLTAGYPCQPFSTAGIRKGTNDARHLWPGVATAIRILRPQLVVLENVAGHLSLGFGNVLGDLAAMGYDTQWGVVRASDTGAPHRRARVFITAHPANTKSARRRQRHSSTQVSEASGHDWATNSVPFDWKQYQPAITQWENILGRECPSPGITTDEKTRLAPNFVEWMMGLNPGHVTDPAIGLSRNQQIHALGNGVVPQAAELALKLLLGLNSAATSNHDELLPTPRASDGKRGNTLTPTNSTRQRLADGRATLPEFIA